MSEQRQGSGAVSLLSSLSVFGAFPLGLGLLLLLVHGDEFENGLVRLMQEGGAWSYAVLASAGLACLVGAILLGLSVRRGGLPPLAAVVPFVLPMAVAAMGAASSAAEISAILPTVDPADQVTILLGAAGELSGIPLLALVICWAGVLGVALGCFVGLLAPERGPRVVTLVSCLLLAAGLFFAATWLADIRGSLIAIAHAAPEDRVTILFGSLRESQAQFDRSNTLLLVAAVAGLIGAVLLAARGARGQAAGLAALLLVSIVGFRGLEGLALQKLFAPSDALKAPPPPALVFATGRAPDAEGEPVNEEKKKKVQEMMAAMFGGQQPKPDEQPVDDEPSELPVSTPAELSRALESALRRGPRVELRTSGPELDVSTMPSVFRTVARRLSLEPQLVPFEVVAPGTPCEGCEKGTLQGKTLAAGGQTWNFERTGWFGDESMLATRTRVELEWTSGDVEQLSGAVNTALANSRVLRISLAK
jgi:hypothetical protein